MTNQEWNQEMKKVADSMVLTVDPLGTLERIEAKLAATEARMSEALARNALLEKSMCELKADCESLNSLCEDMRLRFPTTAQAMFQIQSKMNYEKRIATLTAALKVAKSALETAEVFTSYDSEAQKDYPFSRSLAYRLAMTAIATVEDK